MSLLCVEAYFKIWVKVLEPPDLAIPKTKRNLEDL